MAEPAERPYTVALSKAEVLALSNHHVSQARRITRKVGQVANEMLMMKRSASDLKLAVKTAKEMSDAHITRARGLCSIIT